MAAAGGAIACSVMFCLPSSPLMLRRPAPDRPAMELAEADQARTDHYERGVVEISLDQDNKWVGRGLERGSGEGLGWYLDNHGERLRENGVRPILQVRIDEGAPGRYLVEAAMQGQRCGYERLLVRVHGPEWRGGY